MLKHMAVMHPAAKMLVDLSAAQDVEAGDGTTSVVVIAGSLLAAADRLLSKGNSNDYFACQANAELQKVYIRPSSLKPFSARLPQQSKRSRTCHIQSP